ncbi:hypothetical protein AN958_08575 [Leucoagaricus sp. SymC.cos]|nr:hypothetical protein AN958_08575 [Leucoagaricus sp. SymC.cos]
MPLKLRKTVCYIFPWGVPALAFPYDVVDWAGLQMLDFSDSGTNEGRKALVKQVHDALKNEGFLYIVNHGLSADHHVTGGVRDEIEHYNMNFSEILTVKHPKPLEPQLSELDAFARYVHLNIFSNFMRIIALSLGLDEEYFTKKHDHSAHVGTYNYSYSLMESENASGVWRMQLSVSLPIYKCVAIGSSPLGVSNPKQVVNVDDPIEFFSGRYYKATIRRAHQPPSDQRCYGGVGLMYFASPHDSVELRPTIESPLFQHITVSEKDIG